LSTATPFQPSASGIVQKGVFQGSQQ